MSADQHSPDPSSAGQSSVSLQQFREMVEMLRRTIQGASELSVRLEAAEKSVQKIMDVLERMQQNHVTLQTHQEKLFDVYRTQGEAQNKLNADLARAYELLAHRLDVLEGRGTVM